METKQFLLENKIGIVRNKIDRTEIKNLIEWQTLVKVESFEESLFTSGKVETDFFVYLIIMIEDYFSIVFSDCMLKKENFDTIESIAQMICKAKNINCSIK